jgi:arginine decarboxylase
MNFQRATMELSVMTSVGEGTTLLSAFDAALQNAGVCNYNLIPLSSVIPPRAKVVKRPQYKTPPSEFGHKLYVVKAEIRSNELGKYIAAGIGWYQLEDRRGFFVEHEVMGETNVAVKSEIYQRIKNSLKDLCKHRKIKFNEKNVQSAVSIAKIKNKPTSALVLVVYKSEGWL